MEADLSGEYQKPYAILTQKRLYCKNEMGNYITPSADLLKAGNDLLPVPNRFLWFAVICIVLAVGIEWGIAWDLRERFNWGLWWARWWQGYGLAALVWIAEGVFLCGGSVAAIILIVAKKFQSVNKLILVIASVEVVCNVIWFWLYGRHIPRATYYLVHTGCYFVRTGCYILHSGYHMEKKICHIFYHPQRRGLFL